ncbi:MAG: T9SS type A sorting domain-containing protein, partial [Bacteroidota bacterium]
FCEPQNFVRYLTSDTTLEYRLYQSEYPNDGNLEAPLSALTLDPVEVMTTQETVVEVVNTGCEYVYLSAADFDDAAFTTTASLPVYLYAYDTLRIPVQFQPTALGEVSTTLTLQHTGTTTSTQILLKGNACRALSLEVTTDSLANCGPGEVTLSVAAEADALEWATPDETVIPGITDSEWTVQGLSQDTTFLVRAVGGAGCFTPYQAIDIHILDVPETPEPLAKDAVCGPANAVLSADGEAAAFLWYQTDGSLFTTTSTPTLSLADTTGSFSFQLEAQSELGCASEAVTVEAIIYDSPAEPEISETRENNRIVLVSSAATGNQWYQDGVLLEGASGPTLEVSLAGSYEVVVTNADGCFTASRTLIVTGIRPELFTSLLRMYPNPVEYALTLEATPQGRQEVTSLRLVQVSGQTVAEWQPAWSAEGKTSLSVEALPPGLYYLMVSTRSGSLTYHSVMIR